MYHDQVFERVICARHEMRGSGLDTHSRSPSPVDQPNRPTTEASKDAATQPTNEVFWWLKFHNLSDFYDYFKGKCCDAHRIKH